MLSCMLCCMLVQGRTQTLERTISEIKAKEQRSREIVASLKHSYRYRGGMPSTILSFAFFCFQANLGCHNSNQQHHSQATSAVHARPAIRRAWSTISPGEPILFDRSHVAKTTCFICCLLARHSMDADCFHHASRVWSLCRKCCVPLYLPHVASVASSAEPAFFFSNRAPFAVSRSLVPSPPCNSGAQAKITGLESELESVRKSLSDARRELAENRRDAKVGTVGLSL